MHSFVKPEDRPVIEELKGSEIRTPVILMLSDNPQARYQGLHLIDEMNESLKKQKRFTAKLQYKVFEQVLPYLVRLLDDENPYIVATAFILLVDIVLAP